MDQQKSREEPHAMRAVSAEGWVVRNALQLVVALLVALFGWSANRTLDDVAEDIAVNTARLERLADAVHGTEVEQATHERRLEHLERRVDRLELSAYE